MNIDSLLNGSAHWGSDKHMSTTGAPYSQHATMSSSSRSNSYAYSASCPPSTNQYWYGQYKGYQDTSLDAASTVMTHTSGGSNSRSGSSCHQQQGQHHTSQHSTCRHGQHYCHHTFQSYQPSNGSTHSSSHPYHPCEQHDSISVSSSNNGGQRQPQRSRYEEEEMYFIWYHRVDLCKEWKKVSESFNRQFPSRQRRGFQGIRCKFYRFIKERKCPTLREQRHMRNGWFIREGASMVTKSWASRFGVRERANVWYPWMREEGEKSERQSRTST